MDESIIAYFDKLPDRELVDFLLANNPKAVEYFYSHRCDRLISRIQSMLHFPIAKEELLIEFYLFLSDKNWKRLRGFNFKTEMDTWLTIVAIRYFKSILPRTESSLEYCLEAYTKENDIAHEMIKHVSFKPIRKQKADVTSSIVNASLYAPSHIKKGSWKKIQVFLYKDDEFEEVEKKASMVDSNAKIMSYNPLDMNLNVGDTVDVTIRMYDKEIKIRQKKNRIVWQGSYKSCEFVIQVPKEYDGEAIAGEAEISINGIQIGRLVFIMNVVEEEPAILNSLVKAKAYRKIFISYSHKDQKTAEIVAKICRAQKLEFFFDRHTLNPGDDFEKEITRYIHSADLFILCWSENAAKSNYVKKEYSQAIELSELKKRPEEASLRICPFSIDPKANPPVEMAMLHFEEL